MSGDAKICLTAGKVAGGIARKTAGIRSRIGGVCLNTSKGIKKICSEMAESPVSICKKLNNLYRTIKGKGSIASREEKEKDIFEELGEVTWGMYRNKCATHIFENDRVMKILKDIENLDEEIKKRKTEMALQKEKMDAWVILRRAKINLESNNPKIRKVAILVLNKLSDNESIPHLNRMLDDPDMKIRKKAVEVMHNIINATVKKAVSESSLEKMNKMMDEADGKS